MRRSIRVVSLTLVCAAYIVASSANAQTQSSASSEQSASPGPSTEKQQVRTFTLLPENTRRPWRIRELSTPSTLSVSPILCWCF